ncbi:MAG TPA: low affinity iron permease family protein [Candidatus Limnocylindrales bacterium]|nr:low affinity iron permease family protein [Candidatus Limnocylindrales bacterium]
MTAGTPPPRKGGGTPTEAGAGPARSLGDSFNRIADWLTNALGSFPALAGSVLLVVIWAITGPLFGFSDTWQLFINTTTTVITFWMVFVIQNSANRASKASQLKLDEIIRALADARNEFIALDQAPEEVLVEHEKEFVELASKERESAPVVKRETREVPRTKRPGSGTASGRKTSAKRTGSSRPSATSQAR